MVEIIVTSEHHAGGRLSLATGGDEAPGHRTRSGAPEIGLGPTASILAPRPELPRPLLDAERRTLSAVLGFADFPGRDELRAQAVGAVVVGYCGCGCASVRLEGRLDAPPAPRQPGPIPVYALVLDKGLHPIGRVVVYVAAPGRLWLLEIAGRNEAMRSLPGSDDLRLHVRPVAVDDPP